MLHTKFLGNRPAGSRDFLRVFTIHVRARLIQQFRVHRVMFQESSECLVWFNVLYHRSTMNQV